VGLEEWDHLVGVHATHAAFGSDAESVEVAASRCHATPSAVAPVFEVDESEIDECVTDAKIS